MLRVLVGLMLAIFAIVGSSRDDISIPPLLLVVVPSLAVMAIAVVEQIDKVMQAFTKNP
jgi:hypothetical protein